MRQHVKCFCLWFLMLTALFAAFAPLPVFSAEMNGQNEPMSFTVATLNDRPLAYDRLLMTAFKDLNIKMDAITDISLKVGCELTEAGERDGIITGVPNIAELYPSLRQIPVVLDENYIFIYHSKDSGLDSMVESWDDLSGLRVGLLTQWLYIQNNIPEDAHVTTKSTVSLLFDGLTSGKFDAVIVGRRTHETILPPEGVVQGALLDILTEYFYVNEQYADLIPEITDALNRIMEDGYGKKILNNEIPIQDEKKTILHILSAGTELSREDLFARTLKKQFQDDLSLEWYTLSLNSRRYAVDTNRLLYISGLLRRDFLSRDITAIIVSGESALNFVKEHYFLMFRNVPVLFYGVGPDYEDLISGYEAYFTGVAQQISAYQTVEEALKLFPEARQLFVINDYTTEGRAYQIAIEDQLAPFTGRLNILYNNDLSRDALLSQIRQLPRDALVLTGSYFCDGNGIYYSLPETKYVLETDCPVPIFSLFSSDADYAGIGGKCMDYEKQALAVSEMLKRVLAGETVKDIKVSSDTEDLNQWVFNQDVLNQWNLRVKQLPKGSRLLNAKVSIWESNLAYAFSMTLLTIVSLAVIIGLYLFLKRTRRHNAQLMEIRASLHTAEELLARDEKVKEMYAFMEQVINYAPIAFMMVSDGKIIMINNRIREIFGLSIGDDAQPIYDVVEQEESLTGRMQNNEDIINQIIHVKLPNGKTNRLVANVTHLEYDNKPAAVIWAVNIEEMERNKDQMSEARQSLQLIIDNLPVPIRILELQSNEILYANKQCLELFGFDSIEAMRGKNVLELMPEYQRDGTLSAEWLNSMKGTVRTSTNPYSTVMDYLTRDGKPLNILLTVFDIIYNGHISSVGVFMDLERERIETELRQTASEAEAASQAKSRFLANMSHEIRTPMNSVIGFAELALDGNLEPVTRDYIQKILSSATLMMNLINDILDISKIESGRIELENIPFHMHEIFESCQMIIAPKAEEKGIALYCYAEPSVGRKILGDPTRLRQALLNLLTNAVKFTHNGMVKLLSAIENYDENTVTIRFEVKDSGIGITPEEMKRIFEPFVQADGSTTRKYGGTGLGIPITKSIVELMGGELQAESTPGVGSKFSFTLTFHTIQTPDETVEHVESQKFNKPRFCGEVLVCEDNAMNRQLINEQLKRVGLETVMASNGQDGADIVRQRIETEGKPFDLIFMDIHMPILDGLDASRKLHRMGCSTPVVALTANIMMEDWDVYRASGMQDFLGKPFSTQELWDCLLRHLTPVDWIDENASEERTNEERMHTRMRAHFYQDHQQDAAAIRDAMEAGDTTIAHRLAHTLKGAAGQIGESQLSEAARSIEMALEKCDLTNIASLIDVLSEQLDNTISRLRPTADQLDHVLLKHMNKQAMLGLFDRLEALLIASDTECLDLIDCLSGIPGTSTLSAQIDAYDFEPALKTLRELRAQSE